jgi:hypothetical protein
METKNLFNRKNWVEALDWLLAGYAGADPEEIRNEGVKRHSLLGKVILVLAVMLAWLPLVVGEWLL